MAARSPQGPQPPPGVPSKKTPKRRLLGLRREDADDEHQDREQHCVPVGAHELDPVNPYGVVAQGDQNPQDQGASHRRDESPLRRKPWSCHDQHRQNDDHNISHRDRSIHIVPFVRGTRCHVYS